MDRTTTLPTRPQSRRVSRARYNLRLFLAVASVMIVGYLAVVGAFALASAWAA